MEVPEPIYSKGGNPGGWKDDGWDNDGHYKADIGYVRSEVTRLIDESERELIPKFLRLGFHDCVGGCDGCVDLTNRDNTGLKEPIEAIFPIVDKFKESYSRADIWALATLVAADVSHSFLLCTHRVDFNTILAHSTLFSVFESLYHRWH